jgi:hypothetical protein
MVKKSWITCNMTTLLTARYSSLLGLDSFPHPFFLVSGLQIFFNFHFHFFLFHFHFYCHFVFPLPFSLLSTNSFSLLLFSPFSLFPAISHRFLFCSSCSTQTLLPSSLPWFNTVRLHPPLWISVVLNCLLFLSPSSQRFPLYFSSNYNVPWSPGPHIVILP